MEYVRKKCQPSDLLMAAKHLVVAMQAIEQARYALDQRAWTDEVPEDDGRVTLHLRKLDMLNARRIYTDIQMHFKTLCVEQGLTTHVSFSPTLTPSENGFISERWEDHHKAIDNAESWVARRVQG